VSLAGACFGHPVATASGDVVGPASSVNNAIARYDGISGKLLQNSIPEINDTGTMDMKSHDIVGIGPTLVTLSDVVARFQQRSGSNDQLTDPAVETVHGTGITFPALSFNAFFRSFEFRGRLHADTDNGTDTWQARLRLGGLSGTELIDSGAFDLTAGDVIVFEGFGQVRTPGSSGVFDCYTELFNETTGTLIRSFVKNASINLTLGQALVATGVRVGTSTNEMTLRHLRAEIW
jgi:hypothetical protein